MPPIIKTTRKDMIDAAIAIVRKSGWETLNARELAKKLNCSTQPIFRVFENMQELKESVRKEAWEIYNLYLINYQEVKGKQGLSFGIAYVKFAKEEKNLFKIIFMADEIKANNSSELAEVKDNRLEIIEIFMKISGLERNKAIRLHFNVWMIMHGLASMLATNQIDITEEEIKEIILSNFKAYSKLLQEEVKRDEYN